MPDSNHTPENYHITPSSSQENLPLYLYEFIKTFLYAVYSKSFVDEDLQVVRMTGKSDPMNLKPQLISVTDDRSNGQYSVSDTLVDASVRFHGALYDVSLTRERSHDQILNTIYTLGLDKEARRPDLLLESLKKEAVQISHYNNSLLEVRSKPAHWLEFDVYVERIGCGNDRLEDLVLPSHVFDAISLFIRALSTYSSLRKPLRYLFSGKPGTGKTKIIRAIANHCHGKATFIFTAGNEERIASLFNLVDLFSPVVLCIDDLDLMIGSREDGTYLKSLGVFLQKLDGFVQKDFFLLATTNDKRLVDLAASRPGRFDMIIDVSLIDPHQYLSLVRTKTSDPELIALFDAEILNKLREKNVTGAFAANLVKRLELMKSFGPEQPDRDALLKMIDDFFKGFYKQPEPSDGRPGFKLV
jgi:cell division protease FtsH